MCTSTHANLGCVLETPFQRKVSLVVGSNLNNMFINMFVCCMLCPRCCTSKWWWCCVHWCVPGACLRQLCRKLRGGRLTSCKSAKDRTGMAVTLEEACLLTQHHRLDPDCLMGVLNALRR